MARKLLFMLLALIGLTTTASAENYNVKIGGVDVTSDNYQNITAAGGFEAVKSGTVTYDPATYTLTLSNAVIETTASTAALSFLNRTVDNNLVLAEGTTNTVTGSFGINTQASLTISGGGYAVLTATGTSALHTGLLLQYHNGNDYTTTIRNCKLSIKGNHGIFGSSHDYGSLVIDHADVSATGASGGSISRIHSLTLIGSEIVAPEGAEWNETTHHVSMPGSSDPIMTKVVIAVPHNPEPVSVENEMVLNLSRYDVDGSGSLTIADLTLIANALVGRVNYPLTSLTLNSRQIRMIPNGTRQLTAATAPETADYNALVWTTSNKHVATVSLDGTVSGVGMGTCYIKVQALDGSGLVDSCLVTVIDPSTFDNGSDYVNLGLPSGRLWATRNIGASSPYEVGDYFAFGETWTKDSYDGDNYIAPIVSNGELPENEDAAYTIWGSNWRVPTKEDYEELLNEEYTEKAYQTINGQQGVLITSKVLGYEDKSIFLPCGGSMVGEQLCNVSESYSRPFYWTRSLKNNCPRAYNGRDDGQVSGYVSETKSQGFNIRPVRNQ